MRSGLTAGVLLGVSAPCAKAHAPVPGIEGFYIGLLDPFLASPQLILLLGFGLMIGVFENRIVVWPLSSFLLGTLSGMLFGAAALPSGSVLLATAMVSAAVAVAVPGRLVVFVCLLSILGGFLIGAISIPDPGPIRDRIITILGSFVGINVGLLYIVGAMFFLRERAPGHRTAIGLRLASALAFALAGVVLAVRLGEGAS